MSVSLDPYLFFKGNARQALEFYKGVFGGELQLMTYADFPGDMPEMKATPDYIMHGHLTGGDVHLMAGDSQKASDKCAKIELSISGDDEAKLRGMWDKLSSGGTVKFPLEKAPWGDTFGQLTDKFNIDWMINIANPKP